MRQFLANAFASLPFIIYLYFYGKAVFWGYWECIGPILFLKEIDSKKMNEYDTDGLTAVSFSFGLFLGLVTFAVLVGGIGVGIIWLFIQTYLLIKG